MLCHLLIYEYDRWSNWSKKNTQHKKIFILCVCVCDFEFAKYNNVIVYQQCLNSLAKHEQLYRELPVFFVEVMGQRSFSSTIWWWSSPIVISTRDRIHSHQSTKISSTIIIHSFNIIFLPLGLVFFSHTTIIIIIHTPTDRTNERMIGIFARSIVRCILCGWMSLLFCCWWRYWWLCYWCLLQPQLFYTQC